MATTHGTAGEIDDVKAVRIRGNETLMRHRGAGTPLAIRLLPFTVFRLACGRGLVSTPGVVELLLSRSLPAWFTAIPLPTVTAGADREHYVASSVATPTGADLSCVDQMKSRPPRT